MFVPVISNDIYSGAYVVVQENPIGAIIIFFILVFVLSLFLLGGNRK